MPCRRRRRAARSRSPGIGLVRTLGPGFHNPCKRVGCAPRRRVGRARVCSVRGPARERTRGARGRRRGGASSLAPSDDSAAVHWLRRRRAPRTWRLRTGPRRASPRRVGGLQGLKPDICTLQRTGHLYFALILAAVAFLWSLRVRSAVLDALARTTCCRAIACPLRLGGSSTDSGRMLPEPLAAPAQNQRSKVEDLAASSRSPAPANG